MPKFTVTIPGGPVGNFLAGAAAASVIGGTAVAVTDVRFIYSNPQTGYYSIAPSDLQPTDEKAADAFFNSGWVSYTAPDDVACFSTAVHLPQYARLVAVTSSYESARANFHTRVSFRRQRLDIYTGDWLINHYIEDNSRQRKSITDAIPNDVRIIRNDIFSYSYTFCLASVPGGGIFGDRFYGARITYRYSRAGD